MKKLFINGKFYTFDSIKPFAEAVVVENDSFIDMGTTEEMLLQWGRAGNEVVDLQGKAVTPGLTDSHAHLSVIASNFLDLDLTGVRSKDEMLEKVRDKANTLQSGEWLIGRGWDENLFINGGIPTIGELDHVAPQCPVLLTRICYHANLANTKAFEAGHYHPEMTVPEGGTIVLDEQTKKPTGLLLESAANFIQENMPARPYDKLKDSLRQAIRYALKLGLTSIHTNDPVFLGGFGKTYQLYDELLNEEQMGLRCNLLIDHIFMNDLRENGMYAGFGNDTLQIGAVKIFADGALGRRTALLSQPYSDDPGNFGEAIYTQDELYEIVKKARSLAMPIAVHTIGDQALENVLDIVDQFPTVAYRDRLIHVQILRKELIERLAHPSRIADIQPRFTASDFPWVQDRLGMDRIKLSYAWKSLIDAGVICAGGSDSPIEPLNPLLGIHAAVTQRAPGQTHNGWNEHEKMSLNDAFKLFTVMGAYPTNEEKRKGTITRGKLADMTVYSSNPFQMEHVDELLHTSIDMTITGGNIVFQK